MKIKTNIRAGKKSGTTLSNSDLGISGGNGGTEVETETTSSSSSTTTTTTRCAGY